jgi:hypothetical protein
MPTMSFDTHGPSAPRSRLFRQIGLAIIGSGTLLRLKYDPGKLDIECYKLNGDSFTPGLSLVLDAGAGG